jgi:divalent metal cation (Fe/Co/Zn/Cd) transporter
VESIGALGVSGLLLCGGVFMGLNAGQVLLAQCYPGLAETLAHSGILGHGHGHSHSHGIEVLGPSIHAAWLAAGSIVIKEWLYHASKLLPHCRVVIRLPRTNPIPLHVLLTVQQL